MVYAIFLVLGLCVGSFVNALVWRVHEQGKGAKKGSRAAKSLSVLRGRSICPNCKHQLKVLDLVPVVSWVALRGKCRYCKKPISVQYPLVELGTVALFVGSYLFWPASLVTGAASCPGPKLFHGANVSSDALFILWLILLVGLIALLVYDLLWKLLPNRIMYPLFVAAGAYALVSIFSANGVLTAFANVVLAVVVGGGIFYLLFQVSRGRWIGGGDVKLGWLLGLLVGTPGRAVLFIFIASVLGTLVSVPLLATKRLKRTSTIPFGPFLIIGAIITQLFGASILHWYQHTFLSL